MQAAPVERPGEVPDEVEHGGNGDADQVRLSKTVRATNQVVRMATLAAARVWSLVPEASARAVERRCGLLQTARRTNHTAQLFTTGGHQVQGRARGREGRAGSTRRGVRNPEVVLAVEDGVLQALQLPPMGTEALPLRALFFTKWAIRPRDPQHLARRPPRGVARADLTAGWAPSGMPTKGDGNTQAPPGSSAPRTTPTRQVARPSSRG